MPWGSIMRSMKIPLGNAEYEWHYLHPCALLSEVCKRKPEFGDFVKGKGGPRLCVYMDEIKPGNILHPDPSRQLACFYWTLMNLPPWFHARKQGWFYFASFPTKCLKKVAGGYSYLLGRMLEVFLEIEDPLNFTTGFPCASSTGKFLCQGVLASTLSDEKALKEPWGFGVQVAPSLAVCAKMYLAICLEKAWMAMNGWFIMAAPNNLGSPNIHQAAFKT